MLLISGWLVIVSSCEFDRQDQPSLQNSARSGAGRAPHATMIDVTSEVGIASGSPSGTVKGFSMPQIMGQGVAFLDADVDGRPDVLKLQGDSGCRLYRQQSDGRFQDVTSGSGLHFSGIGMGIAVGDVNNDGLPDVYFSSYGSDRLFQNLGECQFRDITDAAGIRNDRWGTAVAFFDYDRDGWLDLFVANYLDYFPGTVCTDATGRPDYCGPRSFPGTPDRLFRNLGPTGSDAHIEFDDMSLDVGLAAARHKGLGAVCRDFNGDLRPDIFVANDQEANCLWIQQTDGAFAEEGALRGVANNGLGHPEADMGIVCDDLNGDGDFDLFVTHLRGETNTLFVGGRNGLFMDQTAGSGLGLPSLTLTGFGTVAADLEHDGNLDLLVVNGRVKRDPFRTVYSTSDGADSRDYGERNQVFTRVENGLFEEESAPNAFTQPAHVSRGLAAGDVDADGDIDFLVGDAHGVCRVYRNDYPKLGNWLAVKVHDPVLRRDAIGARVSVRAGETTVVRELIPYSSYLSCHDAEVHFGLGDVEHIDSIEVLWPSGTPVREVFDGGGVNRRITLRHGDGVSQDSIGQP